MCGMVRRERYRDWPKKTAEIRRLAHSGKDGQW